MRCVFCTIAISLLVGCQNQAIPVSNPFMSADRVPPPATRTSIPPGTAQPNYSGGPVPGLQPGAVVPPTYAPGNVNPPVTPTLPSGNWNPQPPAYPGSVAPSSYNVTPVSAEVPISSGANVNESPVSIQNDEQNLRFNTPAVQTLANIEPLNSSFQNQAVTPAQFENVLPTPQPGSQTVNVAPREATIRAVSSPGSESFSNSSGFRSPTQDGFRPQGSLQSANASQTGNETISRFGYDPEYRWLRGQLEFEPTSQQWQLRYIPQQGQADQHGGRLLIANPIVLGDLRPGDHVQVQGRLDGQQSGPSPGVSVYTISAVQRQR